MTNLQRTEAFIAAWNRKDGAAIVAAFAPDAIYHNIPMEPDVGLPAITATVERLMVDMHDVQWDILAIAEGADGKVLVWLPPMKQEDFDLLSN